MCTLLIIVTRNSHKLREMAQILSPSLTCISMHALGHCPKLLETGSSFEENASMKVRQLARYLASDSSREFRHSRFQNAQLLADDSGLEVDALGGAPGVSSARFASDNQSENASDEANNAKLLRLLKGIPIEQRRARFRCVLALLSNPFTKPERIQIFSGTCEGRIALRAQGNGGFGYDPIFLPIGYEQSFAQLGTAIKNKLSHRACALANLSKFLT